MDKLPDRNHNSLPTTDRSPFTVPMGGRERGSRLPALFDAIQFHRIASSGSPRSRSGPIGKPPRGGHGSRGRLWGEGGFGDAKPPSRPPGGTGNLGKPQAHQKQPAVNGATPHKGVLHPTILG